MAISKTLDCGEPLTVVTSTSFGLVFTFGLIAFIPLTIGVLVDGYGFSLEQAGLIGSVEIASMTLTGFILALYAQNVSRAKLAQLGCVLGLLGSLLVLVNSTFYAVLLCRIIVGVGIGVITAAVNFSTASSSNAERLYAVSTTGYGVVLVVLFFIAPLVYTEISYPAYFVFFAILFSLGIYLTRWLLDARSEQLTAVETKRIHFETLLNPRLLALYVATLFLWIGLGIVWAISERMGVNIGLTPQQAGLVIATSNAIGLLGSVAANVMGTRLGYAKPLLLCVGVLSLSYAGLAASQNLIALAAAFTLYNLGYYFMIPYVLGTAAQYDESGRAATVSALMSPVAHIITPSLGVYIVATYSFQAVNITALVLAVIAGMFFVPSEISLTDEMETGGTLTGSESSTPEVPSSRETSDVLFLQFPAAQARGALAAHRMLSVPVGAGLGHVVAIVRLVRVRSFALDEQSDPPDTEPDETGDDEASDNEPASGHR